MSYFHKGDDGEPPPGLLMFLLFIMFIFALRWASSSISEAVQKISAPASFLHKKTSD